MINPETVSELPPIKIIRSEETQRQMDTTSIEAAMESRGHSNGKEFARFAILHSARRTLPYGMWTCLDGRQVLFNREYQPILEKKDEVRRYCDHNEWVDHATIQTTQYFYDDANAPTRYLVKHLGGEVLGAKEVKDSKRALLICLHFLKEFTPKESGSVSRRYSVLDL